MLGATVNGAALLVVKATRVGSETAIARIGRLIRDAQMGKSEVQRLADRISAVFVPVVFAISVLTFAAWMLTSHGSATAFSAAVSVLIIACPCALGLATPMALMVGTGKAAQSGIIIRGVEALERAKGINTIVLDKTGTVTTGEMQVAEATVWFPGRSAHRVDAPSLEAHSLEAHSLETQVLGAVAAVEGGTDHPIAKAVARWTAGKVPTLRVEDLEAHAGRGVSGVVDGRLVVVGSARFVEEQGIPLAGLAEAIERSLAAAQTVVVGAVFDSGPAQSGAEMPDASAMALVAFAVADAPKEGAAESIAQLKKLGLTPVMVTGDRPEVARRIAEAVGIDEVNAEVLPAEKVEAVKALQAGGAVVAMAGDGINDAAALVQADLGIAMGTGADVAIEASDLTIVSGDLGLVADAIRIARRTLAVIQGNLFWAFAYNVAAIPLAALGYLNPAIAGAAMAMSSLFVVSNSLRLRK